MTDTRKQLLKKFEPANLYSNFGGIIKSMTINGFRGIDNLRVEFEYPITAISGTNGSGKSTIGQLAACAYKRISSNKKHKRKYVKDFFPVSLLDPTPFSTHANVKFQYSINLPPHVQELTVSKAGTGKGWSGYKRQPVRDNFYVGISFYIPKVERKDLSIYGSGSFLVGGKRIISDKIKAEVTSILSSKYDEVSFQEITHRSRTIELSLAQKYGYSYSENNMGFGEGRLMYMIDLLENAPDKSLFVLEEPETSLHEDAQYKFIKYLMDVCNRKGHQIILSTHSSIILEALPPEGRKFLIRDVSGVTILDRVSSGRAKSILTNGATKSLTVCVEDIFARILLQETIRILRPSLLSVIEITPIGDTKAVASTVKLLRNRGLNAIAVRDADVGEEKSLKLFKLPGTLPPEKEVYHNLTVQDKLNQKYHINTATIFASHHDLDHHLYGKTLCDKASCSEEAMHIEAIAQYLSNGGLTLFSDLMEILDAEV